MKQQPRAWYQFKNSTADPSVAEIYIIDWIGDWVDDAINRLYNETIGLTARAFVDELSKLPQAVTTIRVHINSPGGDVQGGVNIANALREQGSKGRTVETVIDGIAASIASVIAMAGTKVFMADNALMMVHQPWMIDIGNAKDFRKTADVLDTITTQIVNTYKWHSPLSSDDLIALMDAETWLTADEAIEKGLVTDKIEGLKAAASIDPRAVAKMAIPEKYKARVQAFVKPTEPEPASPKAAEPTEVLRLCREGSCLDLAEPLIAEHATLEQVQAKVKTAGEQRVAETARAAAITAACVAAKNPHLAQAYIADGLSLDAVKATLLTVKAAVDKSVEISGNHNPDQSDTSSRRASANPNVMFIERKH